MSAAAKRAACVMHERNGGHHVPCVHCQLAESRAEANRYQSALEEAEREVARLARAALAASESPAPEETPVSEPERRVFACVPDESAGMAGTPWVFCAGCDRAVPAVRRDGMWWCGGCGDRLRARLVVDRDPDDEQP